MRPGNRFIQYHQRRKSFVEYVEEDRGYKTPCWLWQRSIITDGYGQTWENGAPKLAHRAYFERFREPIPSGMEVHHLCGVRCCVNPAHLEAVLPTANKRLQGVKKAHPVCPCCHGTGLAPEDDTLDAQWSCLERR